LYEYAKERYEALPEEQVHPVLLVTGADLIEAGYAPGPLFKEMLAVAEDAQLEGLIQSKEEGLRLMRERFGS
jgi:poly(A) polymerase